MERTHFPRVQKGRDPELYASLDFIAFGQMPGEFAYPAFLYSTRNMSAFY